MVILVNIESTQQLTLVDTHILSVEFRVKLGTTDIPVLTGLRLMENSTVLNL